MTGQWGFADVAGEFDLIASITEGLTVRDDVTLGVGDDAAVLRLTGDTVVTTDILVEGVHFKRQWSSAEAIGRKAVAVNVSDVEAMGARPSSVVVALAFPQDLDLAWVKSFEEGVKQECALAGVSLVGGDLSSSPTITVCVTAVGDLEGRAPVKRSGARVGDVVAVVGRLGLAGAGLVTLQRGFASPKEAVAEQLTPTVPYGEGVCASDRGASSMLDISDGLLSDLGHLCQRSHVGIAIDTSLIPVPDSVARVAAATGKDALLFVLTGGEDHALAATFPTDALPDGWTKIGEVVKGDSVTVDGGAWEGPTGWDHFR